MFTKNCNEKIEITQEIIDEYKNIAYFDIETTGFDKEKDDIILISLGFFNEDNSFQIKQFFSDGPQEEKIILKEFKNTLETFNCWCSYNGLAFDEPFVNRRMQFNQIPFISPDVHIDLYRKIKPYQKQLCMERCNLKSVEKFIGIERKDKIDGGISVKLYEEYIDSRNVEIKDILMLHNYEDVLNLPRIHRFVNEVENNKMIKRENAITEKQLKYLKNLIKKNGIDAPWNYEKLSKKTASKLISTILDGDTDIEELNLLIVNS